MPEEKVNRLHCPQMTEALGPNPLTKTANPNDEYSFVVSNK